MHDIDRTFNDNEYENEYYGEMEFEEEGDFEFEAEGDFEFESEMMGEMEYEENFDESEEMELASELLSVSNEAEMEQFLGKLFKKAYRKVRRVARNPIVRRLGRSLKGIARKTLPYAGRAIGTYFGGPMGGYMGGRLGRYASTMFELELEGLSPEDQELEVAKRFVRFASEAARKTAKAPANANPQSVVKAAISSAAKMHAPGLIRKTSSYGLTASGSKNSGRWIRRGNKIILLGL
ncbi:hypothetical protein DMA11_06960 [Marinilabiliaceae bacterium JC017]|nr:hypothetical protein DMA11_06960 [Marinilabiliaceae bacterium JC017]